VGGGVAAAGVCALDQSCADEGRQASVLAYASIMISCPDAPENAVLGGDVVLVAGNGFDMKCSTHRRPPRPDCGT
jgi:hypothetical protein